jgi:hypothetical protein
VSSNSARNPERSAPGNSAGAPAGNGDKPVGWVGKMSGNGTGNDVTTVYVICAG